MCMVPIWGGCAAAVSGGGMGARELICILGPELLANTAQKPQGPHNPLQIIPASIKALNVITTMFAFGLAKAQSVTNPVLYLLKGKKASSHMQMFPRTATRPPFFCAYQKKVVQMLENILQTRTNENLREIL